MDVHAQFRVQRCVRFVWTHDVCKLDAFVLSQRDR
jgi:hypothetical protein